MGPSVGRSARLVALAWCLLVVVSRQPSSARILKKCDAASELRRSKVINKSFIAHLVCVMQHESKFNTSLIRGPGSKSSYSYGVFQISSDKWCSRYRVGGECQKKCDDFANDDIQDDIVCADKIFKMEGLKHWPGWERNCKNGPLPNLNDCKATRTKEDEDEDYFPVDEPEDEDYAEELRLMFRSLL
ncbi:lysozyme-like [Copidosoma floridanum]|uniref:lysozyme-like n=1 Tax=Copidosoma floridanum TaxID=29053 RepID=UPI0006C9B5B0|nr:lysozyme-like [Copidosoma floridanum]XP_014205706.1 lysozyme-like [Copidosoma floridanum]